MKAFVTFIMVIILITAAPDFSKVIQILQEGINSGLFPGVAIGVGTSKQVLLAKAYGTYEYKRDLFSTNVTLDTKWDLDRVSQILIAGALMHMLDAQKFEITDKVSKYQLDFNNNGKQNLTIQNMMLHNSGFQPEYPSALPKTPEEVTRHINSAKLNYTVGTKTLYSSQGMVVLGEVIQKITNKTLQNYVYQVNVQNGLRNTNFVVGTGEIYKMAPTQYSPSRGLLLQGRVHDAMADLFTSRGAGNAGIFSTVNDVLRFMRILLSGGQINKETRCYQKATVDLFTTKYKATYNNTRAYVFDTLPDEQNPPTGTKFSENSFGIYGLTGTMAWADKDKDVAIVVLSNSVYPNGVDKFKSIAGKVSDAVMTALGF